MKQLIKHIVILLGIALIVPGSLAVESLRGAQPLNAAANPPKPKNWKNDQPTLHRDYIQQPPLIPHAIEGFEITTQSNGCLICHSWENYKNTGATKVSLSHFISRSGNDLAVVSARRYFCVQCHVPQVDAKPLVENTFEPMKIMGR